MNVSYYNFATTYKTRTPYQAANSPTGVDQLLVLAWACIRLTY